MFRNLTRSAAALARAVPSGPISRRTTFLSPLPSSPLLPPLSSLQPLRFLHNGIQGPNTNPVTVQMINYALSHARSQKSDESYAQGMLVLEQCLSSQSSEDQLAHDSKGMVLLAMANLSYERGNLAEAIEHLQQILCLTQSSLAVKVAAMEAIAGLHIELGQDDASSTVADKYLEMLKNDETNNGTGDLLVVGARAKALKGFIELVNGNTDSAESFFQALEGHEGCTGNAALSYGEFLHATGNFSLAREMYEKAIQGVMGNKDFINSLGSCNMTSEEVSLAAKFALGQLESHMGNFVDAEETLTRALTQAEEYFGNHHPKVGLILTGTALMFRNKARQEHSSSFLIQEGLYRRALEFLKASAPESKDGKTERMDAVSLARGAYAELLCVQENRKSEGGKMKSLAEAAWRNRRMSLADALAFSGPSGNTPVIDARTTRVL